MAATKEKARGQRALSKTSTPRYQTPGRSARHSAFYPAIGDGGRALRQLESEGFLETWAASYEGGLASINSYFCQLEEQFIAERAGAKFPSSYDLSFLQIWRNDAAGQLLVRAKPEFHDFIKARMRMAVELPPVPKSALEVWFDTKVGDGVVGN